MDNQRNGNLRGADNRREACQRIVVEGFQTWIDDEGICHKKDRVPVRCCPRHGLRSDSCARSRTVFGHHREPVCLAHLFCQQAGEDVCAASRWERNDNPDRLRCLLPDHTVFVSGGALKRETATVARLESEIYDPATDSWRVAATASVVRLYHSIA